MYYIAPVHPHDGQGLFTPMTHDISQNAVIAFTDGSCYPNNGNGAGGWAFLCQYKGYTAAKYGCVPDGATNNSMELTAILRCLQYVPYGVKHRYPFTIYTDSKYAKNCLTKWIIGWMESGEWVTSVGQAVKNVDVIKEAYSLIERHSRYREFNLKWVKGHSGIPENELVDTNASSARHNQITNWKEKDNKNASSILSA